MRGKDIVEFASHPTRKGEGFGAKYGGLIVIVMIVIITGVG